MRPPAAVLVAVSLLAGAAPGAVAQEDCEWIAPSGNLNYQTIGATTILRVYTPHLRCRDGVRLRADSARYYENNELYLLYGNALFENPEQRLEGELIRYYRNLERIEAERNVRLTQLEDGSVITGEELELQQAGGTDDRLTVEGGRPRIVFRPQPEPGRRADTTATPWDVTADRLFFLGREYMVATGEAVVRRDSLEAYASTVEFDAAEDRLFLRREARMITGNFELEGDSILAVVIGDEIRELTSYHDAVLTGEDMRVAAPRIRVETPEGSVERLIATRMPPGRSARGPARPPDAPAPAPADTASLFDMEHPPRPVARAEDFLMVADSLDVQAPGEVLQRIIAVGRARGESTARDSLNNETTPEIARRDWIDGDTIIASFSPVEAPPADAAAAPEGTPGDRREYRLEQLVSRVNARSLYRMAPSDSAAALAPDGEMVRLAVHYVTGREITISLEEGEVKTMRVVGPTDGVHLDPIGGRPRADTTTAPDTAAADTSGAVGRAGGTTTSTPDAALVPGPTLPHEGSSTPEQTPDPPRPARPGTSGRSGLRRGGTLRIPRTGTGGTP